MHYYVHNEGAYWKRACWRWKLIGEGSLLERQLVGEGLLEKGVIGERGYCIGERGYCIGERVI